MSIDWLRIQPEFLAECADKSYWRYPSRAVHADIAELDIRLPTYPKHELIACKNSILAVFDGKTVPAWRTFPKIGATISHMADKILDEGTTQTVAKKGNPNE